MTLTTIEGAALCLVAVLAVCGILEDNNLLHLPTPWDAARALKAYRRKRRARRKQTETSTLKTRRHVNRSIQTGTDRHVAIPAVRRNSNHTDYYIHACGRAGESA